MQWQINRHNIRPVFFNIQFLHYQRTAVTVSNMAATNSPYKYTLFYLKLLFEVNQQKVLIETKMGGASFLSNSTPIGIKAKTSTAFDCGRFLFGQILWICPGIFSFLRGVFLSRNNLLLGFSVLVFLVIIAFYSIDLGLGFFGLSEPSSLFTA